jgi:hypothetical protein
MIKFRSSREKLLATSFVMVVGMLFFYVAMLEHQRNNRFGDARQTAVTKAAIEQMRYKGRLNSNLSLYSVTVSFFTMTGQGIHADRAMTPEFGEPYFQDRRREVEVIYLVAAPSTFRYLGEQSSNHWHSYAISIATLAAALWMSRLKCH